VPYDTEAIKLYVHAAVKQVLPEVDLADTDDLYLLGLHSLKTTELVMMIKAGLSKRYKDVNLSWLSSHTMCSNPNVAKLATAMYLTLNLSISQ
jgi:acyl carrier protein